VRAREVTLQSSRRLALLSTENATASNSLTPGGLARRGGAPADPVFSRFARWHGEIDPGWAANFLGVLTREKFFLPATTATTRRHVWPPYPTVNEELVEWVDLLTAVASARDVFTMVELGAGYGRWLVSGGFAARSIGLDYRLIGVEAEPTHFKWLEQHLRDNELWGDSVTAHQTAVAAKDGPTGFYVGDAQSWYGQALAEPPGLIELLFRRLFSRRSERKLTTVWAISLDTVLRGVDRVDLIDIDIQGAEADVLAAGADTLDAKVKRVHIGTHSVENEQQLRELFQRLGWRKLNDFPTMGTHETRWGPISFEDGVQTWVNPAL
jgi:FkbM family methyltransferase